MSTLGERIREAMKAEGLTGRELARRMDASESHVSRWIHDKVTPTSGSLNRLAKALRVDPVWLRSGMRPPSKVMSDLIMESEASLEHMIVDGLSPEEMLRKSLAQAEAPWSGVPGNARGDLLMRSLLAAIKSGAVERTLKSYRARQALTNYLLEMGLADDEPKEGDDGEDGNDDAPPTAQSAG